MIYLIDTNVLLRMVHRTDPRYSVVRSSVSALRADDHQLQTTPQNCAEFWNASTRPIHRNGFGLAPSQTDQLLRTIERLFPLLPASAAAYSQWRRLVVTHEVSGVQVHDARLVAAMLSHGVSHILTFNTADFSRYAAEGIVAITPAEVQA